MSPLHLLFGFSGGIGRTPFAVALAAVVGGCALARQAVWWALPWLGSVFGSRGINAGFILNGIVAAIWFFGVWMVLALAVKRLHDRGQSGAGALLAVLPLVALVMLNDEIVLLSNRFVLPTAVQIAVLVVSAGIGLWVLVQGLLPPAADR